MNVPNYDSFGGTLADCAALRNVLRHAGVIDPATGQPLTEAAVFGIAGGIGIGYAFCPSIPRDGQGGGVGIIERHGATSFDGGYQRTLLDRLGVPHASEETASPSAAQNKLMALLDDEQPVLVQCAAQLDYHGQDIGGQCMTSSWSVVVHGIDEAKGEARIADIASTAMTASLQSLADARNAVCTHKNRMITLAPSKKKLTAATLKKAHLEGLRACATAILEPRMKMYSLDGLTQLSKMLTNDKNKAGWLKVFPGGKIYWALRDLFVSVEINTGGGLLRPLFADFLDEAAATTKKKALSAIAADYRQLGAEWTAFAEATLPNKVAPFKKTKSAFRQREAAWHDKGAKGQPQFLAATRDLAKLEKAQLTKLAIPRDALIDMLHGLRGRLEDLHARETDAIRNLANAVR